jgi:hypothetical protein
MLNATSICERVFSAQARNCDKFPVGQQAIVIESEGEQIEFAFLQPNGAFTKGSLFELRGTLTVTIQPETADIIIKGDGMHITAIGCRVVRK